MKKKVSAFDAFFATLFIVLSVYLISFIPFESELLNPIKKTFSDFKLTDIYYSHIKESPDVSEEIVLVNIGDLPREGIAELVNIINKYEPKVVGIDAFFRQPKNPVGDSLLSDAFAKTKNLVLVSELHENSEKQTVDSISYSHALFNQFAITGFADMVSKGKHAFKVSRECVPQAVFQNSNVYSFPLQLAKAYNAEVVKTILQRSNETEDINFQGNIVTHSDGSVNSKNVFYALDVNQVFEERFEEDAIKGKIVIMGFMGSYIGDPSWEDKFFTPLNENYLGKTNPDMFGVVVHANIVAMILKQDYINTVPFLVEYGHALLFIFINVWLFAWMFLNLSQWYDGASIIVTLIQVLGLTIISIGVFHLFKYKLDVTLPMVALFLMGNLVEIYFGIILPGVSRFLHKRTLPLQIKGTDQFTIQPETESTIEKYEL